MTRLLVLVLLLLPLTACSGEEEGRTLTVLAAASLTETFTELAEDFEADHPGVEVELVLGSSTTLAEQAADGAPGDVLATADERAMQLAEGATSESPVEFVGNVLTLVTPPENPADITSLDDLDDPSVRFVVCAPSVPCGAIAATLLEQQEVRGTPASEEVDVKAVLARVTQGEADAGLVYRTDAVAAGGAVTEVPLREAEELATNYLIAPLHGDEAADLAAEFITYVRSAEARQVFSAAGFGSVVRE